MFKKLTPYILRRYNVSQRLTSNLKNSELKELLNENPYPKTTIDCILSQASVKHQNKELVDSIVKYNNIQYNNSNGSMKQLWQASLSLKWPKDYVYQGLGSNKKEAETQAYLMALNFIKQQGLLDGSNMVLSDRLKDLMSISSKSPKHLLANVMFSVSSALNDPEIKLHYERKSIKENLWQCNLTLPWPKPITISQIGATKREAEVLTCDSALTYLYENNFIDGDHQPILISKTEKQQFYEQRKKPVPIHLDAQMKDQITSLVEHFKEIESKLEINPLAQEPDEPMEDLEPINIFTGAPYEEEDKAYLEERNQVLKEQFDYLEFSSEPNIAKSRKVRFELPICKEKVKILSTIENNQVVLISGGTGCGKTTQIPQFILEDFALKNKGTECNIVVTQPRRISAVSISDHIASAMNEPIGKSVGYSIRLQHKFPTEKGAILFCSTGILFQHILAQKELKGISHIIMDEIHERSIDSDCLLNLLKDILPQHPHLKVILMSASINKELFTKYFNNCPIIDVPGFMFPVQQYFLPDILSKLNKEDDSDSFESFDKKEAGLIVDLILHIDEKESPGGILCFLPGWKEIQYVKDKIESLDDASRFVVYPAHSKLSSDDQLNIFKVPPPGQRKVILATNIAETSITINDIVHVIDPGLHKELHYDPNLEVSSLLTRWVSKSSAIQRKGRAGRVAPGTCYHLYPPEIFQKMQTFSTPEIMRLSLVQLTLNSKVYAPELSIKEFLSRGLQMPSEEVINRAISDLQDLKMLTEDEKLTPLGKRVSQFQMHPRLSKSLLYSIFFKCLDPFLTLSACLSTSHELFQASLTNKSSIRKRMKQISNSETSDHLALVSLIETWQEAEDKATFCDETNMNSDSLKYIDGLRNMFLNNLLSLNLVTEENQLMYKANNADSNLVLSVLASSFYPQIIRIHHSGIKKHKIKNEVVMLSLKGKFSDLSKESLLSRVKNFESPWLAYFNGLNLDDRKCLLISNVSMVPPLSLILLTEEPLMMIPNNSGVDIQVKDHKNLIFHCTNEDAELLQETKHIFEKFITYFIQTMDAEKKKQGMEEFHGHLLSVLKVLLNSNLSSSTTNNQI